MKSISVNLRKAEKLSEKELFEMFRSATPHQKNQICDILMLRLRPPKFIFLLTGRIPDKLLDLHNYILGNADYMAVVDPVTGLSNGERLTLTGQQVLDLTAQKTGWFTGDPANPGVWDDHTNPVKKGKNTRNKVVAYIDQFNEFYHALLNIMAASGKLTPTDRLITRIAEVPSSHHPDLSPIERKPYPMLVANGAGNFKVKCNTEENAVKPGLPDNSDMVEIRYAVVAKGLIDSETSGKLKDIAPINANECAYREFHTSAKFDMKVGVLYSGYMLYGWARFINSKHQGLESPWSEIIEIRVP